MGHSNTEGQLRLAEDGTSRSDVAERLDRDWEFLRLDALLSPLPDIKPIGVVDLFAGCGGLTIGALEGARRGGRGASLSLAVDDAPSPLRVLEATVGGDPGRYSAADLGQVLASVGSRVQSSETSLLKPAGDASLLVAGPPCQGHSALNNHTRHDDPRNDLYLAVARVAKLLEPRAVIVENVRGVGNDRRTAMSRCTAVLEELGYSVSARRLDLGQLGVPQTRVRHVLVATTGASFEWDLPTTPPRSVRWAIGDLMGAKGRSTFDTPSCPSLDNRRRMEWLLTRGEYDLPNPLRPTCHRSDHSYVSMYGRLRWDAPAQTITSGFGSMGQGRYVHPAAARTLTPHEAARLQCLPDFLRFDEPHFSRTALATMIGNVAPPLLTTALVESLIRQDLL